MVTARHRRMPRRQELLLLGILLGILLETCFLSEAIESITLEVWGWVVEFLMVNENYEGCD